MVTWGISKAPLWEMTRDSVLDLHPCAGVLGVDSSRASAPLGDDRVIDNPDANTMEFGALIAGFRRESSYRFYILIHEGATLARRIPETALRDDSMAPLCTLAMGPETLVFGLMGVYPRELLHSACGDAAVLGRVLQQCKGSAIAMELNIARIAGAHGFRLGPEMDPAADYNEIKARIAGTSAWSVIHKVSHFATKRDVFLDPIAVRFGPATTQTERRVLLLSDTAALHDTTRLDVNTGIDEARHALVLADVGVHVNDTAVPVLRLATETEVEGCDIDPFAGVRDGAGTANAAAAPQGYLLKRLFKDVLARVDDATVLRPTTSPPVAYHVTSYRDRTHFKPSCLVCVDLESEFDLLPEEDQRDLPPGLREHFEKFPTCAFAFVKAQKTMYGNWWDLPMSLTMDTVDLAVRCTARATLNEYLFI